MGFPWFSESLSFRKSLMLIHFLRSGGFHAKAHLSPATQVYRSGPELTVRLADLAHWVCTDYRENDYRCAAGYWTQDREVRNWHLRNVGSFNDQGTLQIMRWITRENAKVDRIACPWLIRRFVDQDAVFEYLPSNTSWQELQEKLGSSGYVYDVPNCLLGHHGEECSFDSILKHFKLTDPALLLMAKIVRSADTSNKSHAQEGFGLEAIADGFRRISKDDFENQRLQFPVYDALYAYCRAKAESPDN